MICSQCKDSKDIAASCWGKLCIGFSWYGHPMWILLMKGPGSCRSIASFWLEWYRDLIAGKATRDKAAEVSCTSMSHYAVMLPYPQYQRFLIYAQCDLKPHILFWLQWCLWSRTILHQDTFGDKGAEVSCVELYIVEQHCSLICNSPRTFDMNTFLMWGQRVWKPIASLWPQCYLWARTAWYVVFASA